MLYCAKYEEAINLEYQICKIETTLERIAMNYLTCTIHVKSFFFLSELFIDKVVSHMKIELKQECDYIREAECSRVMRNFLKPYPNYYVPKVIDELSGTQIITSEFISGLTIDKCVDLDQETRNQIVTNFLVLLLKELFEFRYMQTDPNWANFLYNTDTKQVRLNVIFFGPPYDIYFLVRVPLYFFMNFSFTGS